MADDGPRGTFEIWVDLVKGLSWPLVALIVLFTMWTPLQRIAADLPDIIERSTSIKIGELAIEVDKGLGQKATPEVQEVLAKM